MDNRHADFYALASTWYQRCNISPDETVLIAADSGTDQRAVDAFFSVASSMGAEAVIAMCQRRGQPFTDVPQVVEEAMLEADFIHQLTTWPWSYSESRARVIRKIQTTGEGRMTWYGGKLEHRKGAELDCFFFQGTWDRIAKARCRNFALLDFGHEEARSLPSSG